MADIRRQPANRPEPGTAIVTERASSAGTSKAPRRLNLGLVPVRPPRANEKGAAIHPELAPHAATQNYHSAAHLRTRAPTGMFLHVLSSARGSHPERPDGRILRDVTIRVLDCPVCIPGLEAARTASAAVPGKLSAASCAAVRSLER